MNLKRPHSDTILTINTGAGCGCSSSSSSSSRSPTSHDHRQSINTQGRLGLSPAVFIKSAMVQQLIRAYRCSPLKAQKEALLRLCVGSFTRQQVNTHIVVPVNPRQKRNYEHVSKVWWRQIRCLAEEERPCVPSYVQRLQSQCPRKILRTEAASSFSSFSSASYGQENNVSQFISTNSHRDALPSARAVFLKGGLSSLSATFTDQLLQSPHHEQENDDDDDVDDDDNDNDSNDDDNDGDEENDFQNEGTAAYSCTCSGTGDLHSREGAIVIGGAEHMHAGDEDREEEEEEEEVDSDRLGAYIQEDDAIFDFDE
jgi:hypothetical protein